MAKTRRARCCTYCHRTLTDPMKGGSTAATRDHVAPKSAGGWRTVRCCRACNEVKGNMMPDQWVEFMRETPEWWRLYKLTGLRGMKLYTALLITRRTDP